MSVARRDMNTYWVKKQRRLQNNVVRMTRQAIRTGLIPDHAADLLQNRVNVSRSRAVLIATDQLLTTAADADRARQRDMGITEYLWRSVGDAKVRGEHRVTGRAAGACAAAGRTAARIRDRRSGVGACPSWRGSAHPA